jgi:hypothetical protein
MIDGKIVMESSEQALLAGHADEDSGDGGRQQQRYRILVR